MVKCNLYRNPFGNVSVILIDNVECSIKSLKKLIGVFRPECLVIKLLALDRNDPFFRTVLDERYNVIFPKADTITSETIIILKASDFISIYESLITSNPRCISFYEIKKRDDLHNEIFECSDEGLIKKGVIDYSVSMIVEECCVQIVFNTNCYNPKHLFKLIKEQFR